MSWMGFLQEQTGSPAEGYPTAYSPEFTAFAASLGVRPGQYLEAHFHSPGNYPLPFGYAAAPGPTSPVTPVVTGVSPQETSYALYGHTIPLTIFGIGRIGGEIIAGPWIENGLATFCISFGFPADPSGHRTLKEIAFDSTVVWENGAFNIEAFTYRFYDGRLDQAVDAIETEHYGADGVAYRPQIIIWFEDLPLSGTKFGKIPYVAAKFSDTSGEDVNLGEAFERIAYSPWCQYTTDDFETSGITDTLYSGGIIIAQDAEFLPLIQQFSRFYRNWSILQTDKLRIIDRGSNVTPDVILDVNTLTSQVVFNRIEPTTVPRVLELATIDPEADYTIVPSRATRTLEPVNVTASVSTESAYLPIIMDSSTRIALVTYTKYLEDVARKKISMTAMMTGLELEPGDFVAIAELGPDFENNTFRVLETTHGANYSVEIMAEAFFNCGLETDPYWIYVVLLMGFEDIDGATGSPGLDDESLSQHGTFTSSDGAVDTAQFKFGSSSMIALNGGLIGPPGGPGNDWALSPTANSDQYTVECWVKFSAIHASEVQILFGAGFLGVSWILGINPNADHIAKVRFSYQPHPDGFGGRGSFTNILSDTATVGEGVWYHIAADKDSTGKIRVYKNGVMEGSATPLNSMIENHPSIEQLDVGQIGLFGTNNLLGWIDEIRITKGIARYASDGGFPLPTSAWPRGGA